MKKLCDFIETFICSLQIDFDDVAAINPELSQPLPLHPKDNLPLQVNVMVGSCHLAAASAQRIHLAFGSLLGCFLRLPRTSAWHLGP